MDYAALAKQFGGVTTTGGAEPSVPPELTTTGVPGGPADMVSATGGKPTARSRYEQDVVALNREKSRPNQTEAQRIADQTGGHYLDQFTNAERATDWRGNNNIAESIYAQMSEESHPIPSWIVVGAGTGGTSATIGRYVHYRRHHTRLCVVDPENSAFFPAYCEGRPDIVTGMSSRIEGIGRPRVEPSFLPGVIDRMMCVPDSASIAAAHHISRVLGRRVGPSTGTNVWGAFALLAEMVAAGIGGSVVTLICDAGDRYADTYYNEDWLRAQGLDPSHHADALVGFERSCGWPLSTSSGES